MKSHAHHNRTQRVEKEKSRTAQHTGESVLLSTRGKALPLNTRGKTLLLSTRGKALPRYRSTHAGRHYCSAHAGRHYCSTHAGITSEITTLQIVTSIQAAADTSQKHIRCPVGMYPAYYPQARQPTVPGSRKDRIPSTPEACHIPCMNRPSPCCQRGHLRCSLRRALALAKTGKAHIIVHAVISPGSTLAAAPCRTASASGTFRIHPHHRPPRTRRPHVRRLQGTCHLSSMTIARPKGWMAPTPGASLRTVSFRARGRGASLLFAFSEYPACQLSLCSGLALGRCIPRWRSPGLAAGKALSQISPHRLPASHPKDLLAHFCSS
jgi:hypothetical protein